MTSLILLIPHLILYRRAFRLNSYYIFYISSLFLVLITGQAFYVESQILQNGYSQILTQYPTNSDGFKLALTLYFLFLMSISLFTLTIPISKIKNKPANQAKAKVNYFILTGIITITLIYYINIVGGINSWIFSIRPSTVGGATLPLSIFVSTSIIHVYKIYHGSKFKLKDYLIITLIVIFLFLSGSRTLIVYYLSTILFSYLLTNNIKLKPKLAISFALGSFFTIIIFQALKEYLSRSEERPLSIIESIEYTIENFYKVGIEGFASFSGYVTYSLDKGFSIDFGISIIGSLFRFIPNQLRSPFQDFIKEITDFYPYDYSIVSSGLENFFAHFSFPGLILYSIIFIILMTKEINIKKSNISFINYYIIIVMMSQSSTLVRGSTTFLIYFVVSQIVIGVIIWKATLIKVNKS